MHRHSVFIAVACLCLVQQAQAQSSSRGSDLTLSAGVAQDARADATVSPLHYQGVAPDFALTLAQRGANWELTGTLDGGSTALSALTPNSGTARLDHGGLRIGVMPGRETPGVSFGATLASRVDVTTMQYQSTSTRSVFAFGYAAVEPTARWRVELLGGNAALELATPVAALIDQPYSDLKTERSVIAFRCATPQAFRGGDASVSYATGVVVVGYRFSYLRYDDANPVRGVSQSLSLGIRTRIGTRATP